MWVFSMYDTHMRAATWSHPYQPCLTRVPEVLRYPGRDLQHRRPAQTGFSIFPFIERFRHRSIDHARLV